MTPINIDIDKIDFNKQADGLVPAIVQDAYTSNILMLGYMNKEAVETTLKKGMVTFFSRSKNRLWTKGETSNNFLELKDILIDCDKDALLIKAEPKGPTCHTGTDTCWHQENKQAYGFLTKLEQIIEQRKEDSAEKSYVKSLFEKGTHKIAQKVGEEATEVVIEALMDNDELFLEEASDLLFHYLILLNDRGFNLNDVANNLQKRNKR